MTNILSCSIVTTPLLQEPSQSVTRVATASASVDLYCFFTKANLNKNS